VPPDLLSYDVVDVFAERPYAGNALAVVHGSQGLPTEALQAIAREFNLSETSFPVPVDASTYEVRIFTPEMEVPFAGHPTVGTAWVLLGGVCVYATERAGGAVQVLARVYCPGAGVPEDPATGSAAAGLGLVLVAEGLAAADGTSTYTVVQGEQVGRPSRLECAVDAAGGVARVVHVGGGVHPVSQGTLRPPRTAPGHSPGT
jgi:trans-2,3-dihydro-3-hydroxyanthranilate isomerase